MTDKIKIAFGALSVACLLSAASFSVGWLARERHIAPPVADTIRIEKVDTVTLAGNKVDTLICYVNRPYPVAVTDTIWHNDTMFVQLPYEHRHLHRPDTLDVWYSGVDARIDSATVYYHHTTELIRQPYEVPKMPRLTAGVGCGAIYQEKRVNAYLFGEMRYNAPKTTFGTFAAIDPTGQWCAGATVSYRLDLIR